MLHPRSLTASLPLKNDGWNWFLLGRCMFRGELLNFGWVPIWMVYFHGRYSYSWDSCIIRLPTFSSSFMVNVGTVNIPYRSYGIKQRNIQLRATKRGNLYERTSRVPPIQHTTPYYIIMAGRPTPPPNVTPRNQDLIAGLIKGNQWFISPDHKAKHFWGWGKGEYVDYTGYKGKFKGRCHQILTQCVYINIQLGGGFKYFLCSPLFGGWFPFWLIFLNWVETTN